MRIIGGKYRGKKLLSPDNGRVRPTSDRAREALFNILRSKLGFDFGSYHLLDVLQVRERLLWRRCLRGLLP